MISHEYMNVISAIGRGDAIPDKYKKEAINQFNLCKLKTSESFREYVKKNFEDGSKPSEDMYTKAINEYSAVLKESQQEGLENVSIIDPPEIGNLIFAKHSTSAEEFIGNIEKSIDQSLDVQSLGAMLYQKAKKDFASME